MFSFAIAGLRYRWACFVGVIVAAAAAVALIGACGMLLESGLRGGVAPERLAASPIVVAGHQAVTEVHGSGDDRETVHVGVTERVRIPAATLDRVRAVPGVADAVADLTFDAHLADPTGRPAQSDRPSWGHGWSSAAPSGFRLTAGRPPSAPGEVAVDAASVGAIGQRVDVVTATGIVPATVVGTVAHDGGPLRHQDAIWFSDDEAARRDDHAGDIGLVMVTPAAGTSVAALTDRLEEAMRPDDLVVLTGAARGRAEFVDGVDASTRLIAIAGSLGGIAAAVAVMVVAGMLALVVQQRHREIALLRAVAATKRQVRRAIQLETLTVVTIGALAGAAPGIALAGLVERLWKEHGIMPPAYESTHSWLPVAVAIVTTILAGATAAWFAGHRASRVRPIEALAESAVPGARLGVVRWIIGVVSVAGTVALFALALHIDGPIAAALVPALVTAAMLVVGLFAPLLTALGARLVGLLARPFGASGHLAAVGTSVNARRLAAAVMPVALMLSVAGMAMFQESTLGAEGHRQSIERVASDHVIVGDAGLPVSLADEVAADPGVTSALSLAATTLYAGSDLDGHPAAGARGSAVDAVLDLDVTAGALSTLRPGEIALSTDLAGDLGAHVGEPVAVRLGDGTPVTPTVVAIYDRSVGFAEALLAWDDVADHVSDRSIDQLFVDTADAATVDRLVALVDAVPGARLGGAELVQQAADADADTQAWVGRLLTGMVAAFAAIAVINTLALSTAERVREFAVLRLVGTTRRQVLRTVRIEAVIAAVLGSALAAGIVFVTLAPYAKATTGHLRPDAPVAWIAALVGAALLLSLAGSQIPARLALRRAPIAAIGAS